MAIYNGDRAFLLLERKVDKSKMGPEVKQLPSGGAGAISCNARPSAWLLRLVCTESSAAVTQVTLPQVTIQTQGPSTRPSGAVSNLMEQREVRYEPVLLRA